MNSFFAFIRAYINTVARFHISAMTMTENLWRMTIGWCGFLKAARALNRRMLKDGIAPKEMLAHFDDDAYRDEFQRLVCRADILIGRWSEFKGRPTALLQ